jgi:predicted DNA-binding protein
MARKRVTKVQTVAQERTGKAVRLDLVPEHYERLDRQAQKRGLNKASLARMIILEWLDEQEKGGSK